MCGIHASISIDGFQHPSRDLETLLSRRGPDHTGKCELQTEECGLLRYLSFTSTVLALRGGDVASQPFIDPAAGSILCWNGEIWKLGEDVLLSGNDGEILFDALMRAASTDVVGQPLGVLKVLSSISGPFAFVFLDKVHSQLFFGRDRLGRRSLLYNTNSSSIEFASTSEPVNGDWKEVEADAIYMISYSTKAPLGSRATLEEPLSSLFPTIKYPWGNSSEMMPSLGIFNRSVPTGPLLPTWNAKAIHDNLHDSLKHRLLHIPEPPEVISSANVHVAVLFSGGLDCTILARMAHDILPPEQDIDLINVAFENPRAVQAAKNYKSLQHKKKIRSTTNPTTPEFTEAALSTEGSRDVTPYEICPDRETGRKSFQELVKTCPSRKWRFVTVDIPYNETTAHKSNVINLIHPHNTEMDLSIAFALYFASRGTGMAITNLEITAVPYTTPARVLLSGLGADELFGGYGRHRVAYERHGTVALLDELELDVNRLGKRNLGRDDRVISHWGKEARFPYLDENFVKWAIECPVWEKCGFAVFEQGYRIAPEILNLEPDKKLLRVLAYELGMRAVATEKKRAIQFGARTAKMEVGNTKGTTLIA